jgi:hypothetical protein
MDEVGRLVAEAILGIDTLWGGDVMCPSGAGRFIADSWFSDEPLPAAYTAPAAARLRASGGVSGKNIDREAVDEYLRQVKVRTAIDGVREQAGKIKGLRGDYLGGLALCLEAMWDLAMEVLGKGEPVPYARCVEASTGRPPEQSQPQKKRDSLTELLGRGGYLKPASDGLLDAVDAWRRERTVPMASVRALGASVIASGTLDLSTGCVTFTGLAPRVYTVIITPGIACYAVYTTTVVVAASTTTTLTVKLVPNTGYVCCGEATTAPVTIERRYDVDWLRVIAVFSVLALHTAVIFSFGQFIVQHTQHTLTVDTIVTFFSIRHFFSN